MKVPEPLRHLTDTLRRLPGIGPKSAQRIAYHLLQHDRDTAERLSHALQGALTRLQACSRCNTFTEHEICDTCRAPDRDTSTLCIVESPADQQTIEQTLAYKGLYFVLMGRLSPLDGIGPRELRFDRLLDRVHDGVVQEVVLATNFTNEGEVTAHVLRELLKDSEVRITRLARGVPVGGELEYVDLATIAQAFVDRREAAARASVTKPVPKNSAG